MEDDYYVIDLAEFVKVISALRKETRADGDFSREFKRGSDFAFDLILNNYAELIDELNLRMDELLH